MAGTVTDPPPCRPPLPPHIPVGGGGWSPGKSGKRMTQPWEGASGALARPLQGKGPQRWPHRRLDTRLEEVAKAVGGGYCRLPMSLKLALASGWT